MGLYNAWEDPPLRSIVTDHYLLDQLSSTLFEFSELVLLMMMYDLEKASKSAPGISLYVSSDRKVATKY